MTNIVTSLSSAIDSAAGGPVTKSTQSNSPDTTAPASGAAVDLHVVKRTPSEPNDVGTALRNAFRATLEEDIPAEMLDLLKRLD
jgi:hypothetical protein